MTAGIPARPLAAIIGAVSVAGMGFGLTMPLLGLMLERTGHSGTLIGINSAMFAVATLTISPLVPRLARRFGVLPLCSAAIFSAMALIFVFPLTTSLAVWFPARYLLGAALTILFAISETWISQVVPDHQRGRVIGIYATCLSAGFAAGPLILTQTGTQGMLPFTVGAIVIALGALPLMLARGVTPPDFSRHGGSILGFLGAAPMLMAASLAYGAVEAGFFNLLPVYGVRIGQSETAAATMLTIVGAGNILLQVPLGMLADRMNRRYLLLAIAVLGAVASSIMPFLIHSPLILGLVLFLWGGMVAGLYTVGLAELGRQFSGAALAGANSAFLACYGLGCLTGPPLAGSAMDLSAQFGLPGAAALFQAAFAVLAAAVVFRRRKTP